MSPRQNLPPTSAIFDDAVAGAGIVGLAHAFHLVKQGRRVIVFERSSHASGASVRNFGMLWPIGQPAGPNHELALRSLQIWLDVLRSCGLWHEQTGSLHLAYREDEAQVLAEFTASAGADGYECQMLTPSQVVACSSAVKSAGLMAGMWSPTETCVDPRQIIAQLPGWLQRNYGVHFEFGCAVSDFEPGRIRAGGQLWAAQRLFVCSGDDFQTLYPRVFEGIGFVLCKLQMMRSQNYGPPFRLGPMLAGGLTLRHYKAFQNCPSLASLKRRVATELPEFDRYGIHVMVSQNGRGELVIGDSHEYDADIDPFDKLRIDALILEYLDTFFAAPDLQIAARWHGTYAKHPTDPYFVARPEPGVTIVTGLGGAGMTLSFGLAEQVVRGTER
ncbi:MAG TPA: TIGR03364 family FAD-dependent oxidoreductase [Pirellulales bacterium]|jgi:FAD dependent oxidoreductase TIGR03364|nr:TIGR03364 family FAD-dependent oxidoreductase [Pirellulales bacterium]